jgi:hypothetical protein
MVNYMCTFLKLMHPQIVYIDVLNFSNNLERFQNPCNNLLRDPFNFFVKLSLYICLAVLKVQIYFCAFVKLISRMRRLRVSALGKCVK